MINSLGNSIPNNFARRYLFDGGGISNPVGNNAIVTNGIYIKAGIGYQSQCLSWGVSTTCTYASITYTNSYIWIKASGVWIFTKNSSKVTATALNGVNGEYYAMLTFFNRTLSEDEEQLLKLEGQRKLGPSNIASYPKLFDGLVGYFENPISTELWNIATGIKATYVGGTNTTDNLGINKAITNPNYTYSSITYTTGYTFENSGSGWSIVTNPTGLSTTGINRTTTLRNIFLFSRTLSADEITTLQTLCNSDYIYPVASYDLLSLRDGLILDLNEKGYDLSGNGNNGTLVNSPVIVRQGKSKGLSYNGSNQYINITNTGFGITSNYTLSAWIKCTTLNSQANIISKDPVTSGNRDFQFRANSTGTLSFFRADGVMGALSDISTTATINDGKWHLVTATFSSSVGSIIYIDGIPSVTSATLTAKAFVSSNLQIGARGDNTQLFTGSIFKTKIWNRALSVKEVQQLDYSQKGNFIY